MTRNEAKNLVESSKLSPSCKAVLLKAIWGTYTKSIDDAERLYVTIKTSNLFSTVNVKARRQYAILEELREKGYMAYERYAGKIKYSLNFQSLQYPTAAPSKPKNALELGLAIRKPITIERVRTWAAAA